MNGNIFQVRPLSKTSFFQRLFKQSPQENAVIELNNTLATTPIREISKAAVENIQKKYNLRLEKTFKLNLEEFYAVFLNYCLRDRKLSGQEIHDLNHLKSILSLDDKTISKLHAKVGEIIYKKTFTEAVSDGRLSESEEKYLTELENTLHLPSELVAKISSETRTEYLNNYISQIISDQRLSPGEETELQAIANSLNIEVRMDDATREQLRKLKLYWSLENQDLPVVQTDIKLQKSEICHMIIPNVDWTELRSVRRQKSEYGYSANVRIAKGFYLRSNNSSSRSFTTNEMKLIGSGTLYLTNKRLLFAMPGKNAMIKLDKILNINPYIDGVEIIKETGKSPTLLIKNNADIFCIMLERLMIEDR